MGGFTRYKSILLLALQLGAAAPLYADPPPPPNLLEAAEEAPPSPEMSEAVPGYYYLFNYKTENWIRRNEPFGADLGILEMSEVRLPVSQISPGRWGVWLQLPGKAPQLMYYLPAGFEENGVSPRPFILPFPADWVQVAVTTESAARQPPQVVFRLELVLKAERVTGASAHLGLRNDRLQAVPMGILRMMSAAGEIIEEPILLSWLEQIGLNPNRIPHETEELEELTGQPLVANGAADPFAALPINSGLLNEVLACLPTLQQAVKGEMPQREFEAAVQGYPKELLHSLIRLGILQPPRDLAEKPKSLNQLPSRPVEAASQEGDRLLRLLLVFDPTTKQWRRRDVQFYPPETLTARFPRADFPESPGAPRRPLPANQPIAHSPAAGELRGVIADYFRDSKAAGPQVRRIEELLQVDASQGELPVAVLRADNGARMIVGEIPTAQGQIIGFCIRGEGVGRRVFLKGTPGEALVEAVSLMQRGHSEFSAWLRLSEKTPRSSFSVKQGRFLDPHGTPLSLQQIVAGRTSWGAKEYLWGLSSQERKQRLRQVVDDFTDVFSGNSLARGSTFWRRATFSTVYTYGSKAGKLREGGALQTIEEFMFLYYLDKETRNQLTDAERPKFQELFSRWQNNRWGFFARMDLLRSQLLRPNVEAWEILTQKKREGDRRRILEINPETQLRARTAAEVWRVP